MLLPQGWALSLQLRWLQGTCPAPQSSAEVSSRQSTRTGEPQTPLRQAYGYRGLWGHVGKPLGSSDLGKIMASKGSEEKL